MTMRKRWIWALVLAVAVVAAAVAAYAGTVRATAQTPSLCFTSTSVFGEFGGAAGPGKFGDIFSQTHGTTADSQQWNEVINTVGPSDLFVTRNKWDPSACSGTPSSGWHIHPGPSFITVTKGSVTVYHGDDPTCTGTVYSADGTHNGNAFVEPGGDHVHIVRDESGAPAETVAVQLIPKGQPRRVDQPDPGNCPF
jgi:hypothetical protein